MLDFMIIALPRSGTTWAANWLTTESTFCAHDPLWTTHYSDFDRAIPERAGGRLAGISCTAIWRWPNWLAGHPARKVIIHRDVSAVRRSMAKAGLPMIEPDAASWLAAIDGMHVAWTDLFKPGPAVQIWQHLAPDLPFDRERHRELSQARVEPNLATVKRDIGLNKRLGEELGLRMRG